MAWNSELNVFKNWWFFGEISNGLPDGLFGTNVYYIIFGTNVYKKLLSLVDNHYWQCYNELILLL